MSKIRLFGASSGYVEIAPAAAASNNTLTAPSTVGEIIAKDAAGAIGVTSVHTTNITATGIATITTAKVGAAVTITESGIEASGIGITCANINGGQIGGRRNIIINGAMQVAQRGTSSSAGNGYYTVDRMKFRSGGNDETNTVSQISLSSSDTGPYQKGFRYAYRIQNGNQTSGAGSSDWSQLEYHPEAQDLANSGWDYTNSNSFITLSFWIRSSVGQRFYGYMDTKDGTSQRYSFAMDGGSALSANTWRFVSIAIPGNSNLQFDNNSDDGLEIKMVTFYGTDYTDNSYSMNNWAATGSNYMPDYDSTWYTTNDATWDITGLQLEVGPEATAFEHRTFGEELALCQRYCYVVIRHDGSMTGAKALGGSGSFYTSDDVYMNMDFPVTMRSTPTLSCVNKSNAFQFPAASSGHNANTLTLIHGHTNGCTLWTTTSSTTTPGYTSNPYFNANNTTEGDSVIITAEL